MAEDASSSFILGQVLRSNPALALRLDKSGKSSFSDHAIVARLIGMDSAVAGIGPDIGHQESLAQSLVNDLLSRLPRHIDLDSLQTELTHDLKFEPWTGTQVFIRLRIVPLTDFNGNPDGFVLFCYDITEQKQADLALARKNSSLELLLACSHRANGASSFQQALTDCMEAICSFENWLYPGWLVAHAFLVDEADNDRLVSSALWFCQDRARLEPFIELTRQIELRRGDGIPGRVLESGRPIWQGRLSSYPRQPRAALADELGLVSLVAVPVISGERVVAVLEFFADNERPPNGQMLDILMSIGRDLGLVFERDFANRELQRLADQDPLTGLVVMRVARDRIGRALAGADRNDQQVALLFIDLDGFKHVNDSYGHDTGDQLLRHVAGVFNDRVREVDTVARVGGDEFIVLLVGEQSAIGADKVAGSILENLALPVEIGENRVNVGASIGISIYPGCKASVDEMIRCADSAMYEAKRAGKHCFRIYNHSAQADPTRIGA